MIDRYRFADALRVQAKLADARSACVVYASKPLQYVTSDEAALLAEAARMIGRVSDRLYRDLVLVEPLAPGRCSCGADAYCTDYLTNGYHKGQMPDPRRLGGWVR